MASLKAFFAKVANSQHGILVPEELLRSIVTALGSGSAFGIVLTIVQTILANVAMIFPNPLIGALATMFLTLIADLIRRLNQGHASAPVPVPVPVPAPVHAPAPAPAPVTVA